MCSPLSPVQRIEPQIHKKPWLSKSDDLATQVADAGKLVFTDAAYVVASNDLVAT